MVYTATMSSEEIRKKFLEFFHNRGHAIVPSSSLVPDDPSVLLTTAGMQQFKKYFMGELNAEKDFKSLNTVSAQKCFRTSDIDEVGDESHLTFFEMLGNFSFGGYWKKEAIQYAYDFIVEEMNLKIGYVSVFGGGDGVPADEESEKIWKSLDPKIIVKKFGRTDNFWGPTGNEGPCGPTTEIYINDVEVWNVVFNEYYQKSDDSLEPLTTKGIDTGMGLERLAMAVQRASTIFETDLFAPLMKFIPESVPLRIKRIAADHARGVSFLLSDGVRPENKGAGYVLRRLLRRVFVYQHLYMLRPDFLEELMKVAIEQYGLFYPELITHRNAVLNAMWMEYERFQGTLSRGMKELEKLSIIDAEAAFRLYESFGLPYEIIKEVGANKAQGLTRDGFDEEFKKHQEISRAGLEKKFGGHGLLLDTGELKAKDEAELKKVTRLHTATHMLQQALRDVLGPEVKQMGSDITVERTRFDFAFPRKLTAEEIKKIEDRVNEKIRENLSMQKVVLPKAEAEKTGALYFFKEKYPDPVNVYFIGKELKSAWSKEFCGGPHVQRTGEIGTFKIVKEESVGAGTRRIRGVVEP